MGTLTRGIAFLIPFLVAMVLVKLPLTFMERSVGQFFRRPLPEIYAIHGRQYVGQAFVVIFAFVLMAFFHMYLTIYCLLYCVDALTNNMAWINSDSDDLFTNLRTHFRNDLLQLNRRDEGYITFNTKILPIYLLLWGFMYFALIKGLRTYRPFRVFLLIGIYGSLTVMLIHVLRLPGSIDGIKYLITPRVNKIFNMQTWKEALDQNYFQGILEHTRHLIFAVFKVKTGRAFNSSLM